MWLAGITFYILCCVLLLIGFRARYEMKGSMFSGRAGRFLEESKHIAVQCHISDISRASKIHFTVKLPAHQWATQCNVPHTTTHQNIKGSLLPLLSTRYCMEHWFLHLLHDCNELLKVKLLSVSVYICGLSCFPVYQSVSWSTFIQIFPICRQKWCRTALFGSMSAAVILSTLTLMVMRWIYIYLKPKKPKQKL